MLRTPTAASALTFAKYFSRPPGGPRTRRSVARSASVTEERRRAVALELEAAAAGLHVYRVDIDHAHGKKDFLARVSRAMHFPDWFGGNWDAFADCLKDLSWTHGDEAAGEDGSGWVIILEKSKHYCDGHRHDFEEAVGALAEAAEFWRGEGRPLWALIGGPDGWKSGWPDMPLK